MVLAAVTIVILVKSLSAKDNTTAKQQPKQSAMVEVKEPDASSEMGGAYYGLCKKNSIRTIEDFRRTVERDVILSNHFAGFNWGNAKLGKLDKEEWTFVSYRKGNTIKRTSKPVRLPEGDEYISDGVRTVRTLCCNDYVIAPPPVEISMVTSPKPTECVDDPPQRAPKSERVDGPPLQLSSGAPAEESANAIPEILEKYPHTFLPYYGMPDSPDSPYKVYSSPRHEHVVTPEPGTMYLMGGGIAVIALMRLLRRKGEDQKPL
jgi:hypothetical protein